MAIVRSEGADALTLGHVAEVAGVTKPVAYEHFQTRFGLLQALYTRIDEQQTDAARAALEVKTHTLEETVQILAVAYVDCVLHIGKEFGTITAALSTNPNLDDFIRAGRERYASIYVSALSRFGATPKKRDKTIMLGVIGAAETLAREVTAGLLSRQHAIDAIGQILLGVTDTSKQSYARTEQRSAKSQRS